MQISSEQRSAWQTTGHLTVPGVFSEAQIAAAESDLDAWGEEFLATLPPDDEAWYLEQSASAQRVLRKLDNPVFHRPVFLDLANDPQLTGLVEALIGPDLMVVFSQVFLKPPGIGGPKPIHQDNFYFGPANPDRIVTAWIAIDEATTENGCLQFGEGSNQDPILEHVAPPGEPFNLQVPSELASEITMTPAPVPRGGVSFHHGNTLHQSGENRSDSPRRAVAMHFLSGGNRFVKPALDYDESVIVEIR